MLGSINGKVKYKGTGYVILEAGQVGYKVSVTPILHAKLSIGQEKELVIFTYVREDQLSLYGFETIDELEFFELLLTVSGVGPKSALGIMSLAKIDMIKSAIVSEDPSVFTKVAGIGRKTAERVIVELKEKLKDQVGAVGVAQEHSDALDALVSLGYSVQEARDALKSVPVTVANLQDKIKMALKNLSK